MAVGKEVARIGITLIALAQLPGCRGVRSVSTVQLWGECWGSPAGRSKFNLEIRLIFAILVTPGDVRCRRCGSLSCHPSWRASGIGGWRYGPWSSPGGDTRIRPCSWGRLHQHGSPRDLLARHHRFLHWGLLSVAPQVLRFRRAAGLEAPPQTGHGPAEHRHPYRIPLGSQGRPSPVLTS